MQITFKAIRKIPRQLRLTGFGENLVSGGTSFEVIKDNDSSMVKPQFLEFFAGSGLVAEGLKPHFQAVWANDICPNKAAVYTANHGSHHFLLGSIEEVEGQELPIAPLAWASFPCQDLSLAGLNGGIHAERSGLVWHWLRIMDELSKQPPVLVAENVTGLLSSNGGANYRVLHQALRARGYLVGPMVLDAINWVPQSRPRVFVVAVKEDAELPAQLLDAHPNWMHPGFLVNAIDGLDGCVYWHMPLPKKRKQALADLVEWDAPTDTHDQLERKISLISLRHKEKLNDETVVVAPGYKRTRAGKQVLELRFDGVAGCLRTAEGGSSRQELVLKKGDILSTRLLTVRETARLMGAPDSYQLPGSYNQAYTAMGDAVAVPVARHLAKHLLAPLVESYR